MTASKSPIQIMPFRNHPQPRHTFDFLKRWGPRGYEHGLALASAKLAAQYEEIETHGITALDSPASTQVLDVVRPLLLQWRTLQLQRQGTFKSLDLHHPPQGLMDVMGWVDRACRHTLKMRLFKEQWQAALLLAGGHFVDMKTGEGKTLAGGAAALLLYALGADQILISTANEHLVSRDAQSLAPWFNAFGLRVGVSLRETPMDQKRDTWFGSHVVFATASEMALDHLRSHMMTLAPVVPAYGAGANHTLAAIVDEVDAVL